MGITYDMLDHGSESNYPLKVVIHSMGENINNKGDIYTARDWLDFIKLSAHYLVKPDGEIIQCRANNQGAWHARGHNKNSIGIEFLVAGTHDYESFLSAISEDWCTKAQYESGIELVTDLQNEFEPAFSPFLGGI